MKTRMGLIVAAAAAIASGCSGGGMFGTTPNPSGALMAQQNAGNDMVSGMMAKQQFQQEMMKNPDLPAWHAQREKMAMAVGDRVFDKGFDRVFDSMITTLASLGCRVNNMERASGYITSSLPQLPPEQHEGLRKEALAQYAQAKGYPPSVLQKPGSSVCSMSARSSSNRRLISSSVSSSSSPVPMVNTGGVWVLAPPP